MSAIRIGALARRSWLPGQTVRRRLAFLYAAVFIVSGGLLLVIVVALFARGSSSIAAPAARALQAVAGPAGGRLLGTSQHSADFHTLLIISVIAFGTMSIASMWVGWLIAGRVLAPLRTITVAARQISATNLNRRLALEGPDDELKELGDTFDDLLARLEVSFESQRQFVANASHELKTPLARLKTVVQVTLEDPDATAAELRTAHERVLVAEQQLESLIEALLALATSGRISAPPEQVDVAAVLGDLVDLRGLELQRRDLELELATESATVLGNPLLVERVVANLLDNAIRHNVVGGRIEATVRPENGRPLLAIANDGPRLSSADVERIQRPFERLEPARMSHDDGHGLGLPIVNAIAVAIGARVELRPGPDGGLEALVRF